MNGIRLTKCQSEILREFYSVGETKVIYDKAERNMLWKKATSRSSCIDFNKLRRECPALEHQIIRSYKSKNNIQSAVFSECVYAQTLANMMGLVNFNNCYEESGVVPETVGDLLSSYSLGPRYIYSDISRMLIQAGSCSGIDSALITVIDLTIYTIEFKEPGAKTSEPDLPKYGENGLMTGTKKWLKQNPQFREMLSEQKDLNFFDAMGQNINNFSPKSLETAVSNNYRNTKKKFADVVCTEDRNGYLVMLPTNQISNWATIEGEIRPSGRNHYEVWTPLALERFLREKGANINNGMVEILRSSLGERRQRGGAQRLSGYKINPLFFVRLKDCHERNGMIFFNINKVRQLKPTIAAKMFFRDLSYQEVRKYYGF